MDPQAQRPVCFFVIVTDKRNAENAKAGRKTGATIIENGTEVPLHKTRIEFDEDKIDQIVSDVRDGVHLNARRATQGKYE
jgi:hypothetical protein